MLKFLRDTIRQLAEMLLQRDAAPSFECLACGGINVPFESDGGVRQFYCVDCAEYLMYGDES